MPTDLPTKRPTDRRGGIAFASGVALSFVIIMIIDRGGLSAGVIELFSSPI